MATIPSTQTFVSGEKVTADKLNAATKTPLDFMMNPPRSCAFQSADLSTTSGTWTLIPLVGEQYDTDSMHSTTTNTSRIYINTSGLYLLSVYARWNDSAVTASGRRSLNLRANSGGLVGGGTSITTLSIAPTAGADTFISRAWDQPCTAGDYLELFTYHNQNAALTVLNGWSITGVQMRWVGFS
jgi:hypothetical protein